MVGTARIWGSLRRGRQGLALLALLGLGCPGLAQVPVQVTGTQTPEVFLDLLTPHLPAHASPGRLTALATEILATEGYFSPTLEVMETAGEIRLALTPGPRTRIATVDLHIDGAVPEGFREQMKSAWHLPVDAPFRQADWNQAKQQVLAALLADEFAAARLVDSQADIDVAASAAHLRAHYAAGPRYRLGDLRIDGLYRYDAALVGRYNRSVRSGQPYRESDLAALVANLQASPYFSAVRAELETEAGSLQPDGTVVAPVRLVVRERAAHRLGFGAGASSNTGARVETAYHTPNLFGQAWQLESGVRLEERRQTVYGDVHLPPDGKNRRFSVGAMVERSDIQGLRTQREAFGLQSLQLRGKVEQRLSLNLHEERREPEGAAAVESRALVPGVTWVWRDLDAPLDPRRGTVLQLGVAGGVKLAVSDQNFLRLHGRWQQYLPVGRRDVLSLRVEAGQTLVDSAHQVPQDYLFRAGGAGSVRGYAYQSLGVREGEAIVGATHLVVGSVEYTHWLNERWGIAAFVDAGDAVNDPRHADPAVGYGLGARWRSPAGPIGADLAWGERTGRLQLHFALSIPF